MRLRKENVHVLHFADDMVLAGVDDGVRKLELVKVAKYLLVIISGDRRIEGEIRNRIGKASRAIHGEEEGAEQEDEAESK